MADSAQAVADDELAKFREQWRKEVEGRKRQQEGAAQGRKTQKAATTTAAGKAAVESVDADTRERPRGILDVERRDDQKIKNGILQDEVELARAIGSIQLGKEKSLIAKPNQEHKHAKPHSKPASTTKPLSPKLKHAQPAMARTSLVKDPILTLNTTKRAVEAYSQAVDLESSGQLNEALHLYRKAYKLDDRVEKAYNSAVVKEEERNQAVVEDIQVVDPGMTVTATPPPLEPYVFRTHTQLAPDYHSPARTPGRSGDTTEDVHAEWTDPLTRIINKFEEDLYTVDFIPEEEKWPVLLARLPDEVVENIVFFLDVQSLERFALTCKKARLVTRAAPVWRCVPVLLGDTIAGNSYIVVKIRYLCERIYRPPLLPLETKPVDLAIRHGFDWRSTFLEERRLRYDGLYISVCHYM
ncbi:hypothetical protein QFC19_005374 [Naganishia cerealis]|uniref:Uncharacterized protein n=1 Tax=Naganishia cerealis TaxID=610337 RepID=A0ACC2VP84_9TREE|nr:hypothetical protein QFC19_005374 [Naganishia cerealis]